ncbi:Uncharacterised protein [Vibrio cholerae]|nr:Uncharacterised protein [Vibrio cholerae]CSI62295.1 Uncharacterised protein [Vibrio cholerae]
MAADLQLALNLLYRLKNALAWGDIVSFGVNRKAS